MDGYELEKSIFSDISVMQQFICDIVEPYLEVSESPHLIYRLYKEEQFSAICGDLLYRWITQYKVFEKETLKYLVLTIMRYHPNKLIAYLNEHDWLNTDHKDIWINVAFLLDFKRYSKQLQEYAHDDKENISVFYDFLIGHWDNEHLWADLSIEQSIFLIKMFAPYWPYTELLSGGWRAETNKGNVSRFLIKQIDNIASDQSENSVNIIDNFISCDSYATYRDYLKHTPSNVTRKVVDESLSVIKIKKILFSDKPNNHDEFQDILMDEINDLEKNLRTNNYNSVDELFWENGKPRIENVCRNILAHHLEPWLKNYHILLAPETKQTKNRNCDILMQHHNNGLMHIPIEIKGQWHPELWTAHKTQLKDYSEGYHTNGYGIYLILWFGDNEHQNRKLKTCNELDTQPETIDKMYDALLSKIREHSKKIQLIVFDLSKPIKRK